MNKPNRNAWTAPTGHDTLLNGALIAAGMVGLVLSLLDTGSATGSFLAFAFA